jgi:hypothetical protein
VAAPQSAQPAVPQPSMQAESDANRINAMIARGITPNGDPISPDTTFTLPMNAVAIRIEYPAGIAGALRFQLLQGNAVLSTCIAQKTAPGTAWCKFAVDLRKGLYSISFAADNAILGRFPFTVIGR